MYARTEKPHDSGHTASHAHLRILHTHPSHIGHRISNMATRLSRHVAQHMRASHKASRTCLAIFGLLGLLIGVLLPNPNQSPVSSCHLHVSSCRRLVPS